MRPSTYAETHNGRIDASARKSTQSQTRREAGGARMGSASAEESLWPQIHHGDEQEERRNRAVGRRKDIGGNRLEVAYDVGCDERSRDAPQAAEYDDGEGARSDLTDTIGADTEKHAEQHTRDTGEQAVEAPHG